jgi:hypothetical protein
MNPVIRAARNRKAARSGSKRANMTPSGSKVLARAKARAATKARAAARNAASTARNAAQTHGIPSMPRTNMIPV